MSVMSSACVWILCRIVFACVVGVRVATEIVREAGESEIDGMGGRPETGRCNGPGFHFHRAAWLVRGAAHALCRLGEGWDPGTPGRRRAVLTEVGFVQRGAEFECGGLT